MGYTQTWYKNRRLDKDTFKAFSIDCEKVLKASGVPLTYLKNHRDVNGYEVTDSFISFNGAGEDAHETFYFERDTTPKSIEIYGEYEEGKIFGFCKTNQKPYDVCVVACLFLAKIHFGYDVKFVSDGDIPKDLEDGARLVKMATEHDFTYEWVEGNPMGIIVHLIEKKLPPPPPEDLAKKRIEEEKFKANPNYELVG